MSGRKLTPVVLNIARRFASQQQQKGNKCKVPPPPGVAAASKAPREVTRAAFKKLKENQKRFQVDDGLPVYLKGGITDKIFYQLSWIMVLAGLGLSIEYMYRAIFKL